MSLAAARHTQAEQQDALLADDAANAIAYSVRMPAPPRDKRAELLASAAEKARIRRFAEEPVPHSAFGELA